MVDDGTPDLDAVSRFLGRFMDGPLPAMLMLFAMAEGVAALLITPREEEPQIVVVEAGTFIRDAAALRRLVVNNLSYDRRAGSQVRTIAHFPLFILCRFH